MESGSAWVYRLGRCEDLFSYSRHLVKVLSDIAAESTRMPNAEVVTHCRDTPDTKGLLRRE